MHTVQLFAQLISYFFIQGQLNDAKSENELEGINVIGRRMSDTAIIKGETIFSVYE